MTIQLHLYSTSYCHLCEEAKKLIATIADAHDIHWVSIEIADDAELLEEYGTQIPVLLRLDTNTAISWPFNMIDIQNLINN